MWTFLFLLWFESVCTTHAFGHCVTFSGNQVTAPPGLMVPVRLWLYYQEVCFPLPHWPRLASHMTHSQCTVTRPELWLTITIETVQAEVQNLENANFKDDLARPWFFKITSFPKITDVSQTCFAQSKLSINTLQCRPQAFPFLSKDTRSTLVHIALFSSLSRQSLGTRIEGHFDSRSKNPPARRWEKGYGDDNGREALGNFSQK